MKKTIRLSALVMAFAMALSLTAFASGEAGDGFNTALSTSGEAETNTAIFTVGEDGLETAAADDYALTGEITAQGADGVDLTIYGFTTSGINVTAGAYTIANSTITAQCTETTGSTDAGGYCAGVTGGILTIQDSTLTASGKGGVFGNYTVYCAENGTLVVIRSNIIQLGTAGDPEGYTDAIMEPGSNGGLLISGYSRANMSMGVTKTYYYGSYVETDGWAAMSTDMTRDLSFYAFDSVGRAVHGGYGTYADSSCKDYFYGCVLSGAEIGAIIANNGEIHLASGEAATPEALEYLPDDYQVTEEYTARQGRSLVEAGRNCVQIHSPEESKGVTRGMTAVFTASDTDFVTSAALDENANLVDWAEDYGVSVAEYIDFVKGSVFLVKSAYADIDLTACTAESSSGTLLMTAVNSDSMSCYALTSHDMTGRGTDMTLTDCDIAGDVKAYDYQRNCVVRLVNTAWSGAYETWDKAAWDGAWSGDCAADGLCCWILDPAIYHDGTGNGSTLIIDGSSCWTVTGESQLTWLTVEPGGAIEGTVTVDGAEIDVTAGGSWEGRIVITPPASAEPSGEAS